MRTPSLTELRSLSQMLGVDDPDAIALRLYNQRVADLSDKVRGEFADDLRAGIGGEPTIRAVANKARASVDVPAYRAHQTIREEQAATGRLRVSTYERVTKAVARWRESR